jgi:hypothetical protein
LLDRDVKIYARYLALRKDGITRTKAILDLSVEFDLSDKWITRIIDDVGFTPPERAISFLPD